MATAIIPLSKIAISPLQFTTHGGWFDRDGLTQFDTQTDAKAKASAKAPRQSPRQKKKKKKAKTAKPGRPLLFFFFRGKRMSTYQVQARNIS